MPKKTTKKVSAKPEKYLASAKIMGKTFKGEGETIYEAIGNITTGGVVGMVILTVSQGKSSKERVIPMARARRLFNTLGMTREVSLKNMSLMFDGV